MKKHISFAAAFVVPFAFIFCIVPSISSATILPPPIPATLHVVKQIVNVSLGIGVASDFTLHVSDTFGDVLGSPAPGSYAPGTPYILPAGTYTISEDATASSTTSFTGDCDSLGVVVLAEGDDKICNVINTEIPPILPTSTPPVATSTPPVATTTPPEDTGGGPNNIPGPVTITSSSGSQRSTTLPLVSVTEIAPPVLLAANISTPSFPETGFPPELQSISWSTVGAILAFVLILALRGVSMRRRIG